MPEAPKNLPKPWAGTTATDVWNAAFGHPCAHLPPPDFQALAIKEQNVLGVGNLYVRRIGGSGVFALVGWLVAGAVLPDHQRRGIGASLVQQRHTYLRSVGVHFAAIDCAEEMVAHNERLGYKRVFNLRGPGAVMICELDTTHFPTDLFTHREGY